LKGEETLSAELSDKYTQKEQHQNQAPNHTSEQQRGKRDTGPAHGAQSGIARADPEDTRQLM